MRIEGPNKSKSVSKADKAKKKNKSGSSQFSSFIQTTPEQDSVDHLPGNLGIGSTTSVDALLSVQQSDAPDPDSGSRRQAMMRGEDILDYLEEMRLGLLMGDFSKNQLENLSQMVDKKRQNTQDPRLEAILNEIDLRARVELAKFGKY